MMPARREPTWSAAIAGGTAAIVAIAVRALIAPLQLFVVVEWGLAILIGIAMGLVAVSIWQSRRRQR